VTIIEIEIFYENQTESTLRFFLESVTRLQYHIALEGSAQVTEWVLHPARPITPSAEEFISSTPNTGAKKSKSNRRRILYKKFNRN